MESTQRRCPVTGCERIPEPGWTMCRSHVDAWLDRALTADTLAAMRKEWGGELPRYTPESGVDELEMRAMDGDR